MAAQRRFLWICVLALGWGLPLGGLAQTGDSGRAVPARGDSGTLRPHIQVLDSAALAAHRDSVRRRRAIRDSLVVRLRRDSTATAARDSVRRDVLRRDSLHLADSMATASRDSLVHRDSLVRASALVGGPGGPGGQRPGAPPRPDTREGTPKIRITRDLLFCIVVCLALWMGLLKSGYQKYYSDLFTVFFRSSLRQHQIREQLLQARLPSLLFNLYFVGCAGTFLYLLTSSYAIRLGHPAWELWTASIALVALLYAAKFVGLKLSGWVFGMSGAVDTYIFIVFLVNKILGVALLPIVVLLAFAKDPLQSAGATLGVLLVIGMLIYRFIRSYRPVWEEVQMSRFHFFLYLCAFELAPLLLIYKTMLKLL